MSSSLPKFDALYFSALLKQRKKKSAQGPVRIGRNFFPSALLSARDREILLGIVPYESLLKSRARYEKEAQKSTLVLNPMNGGVGTTLARESYLKKIWPLLGRKGKPCLGSKGSDLFFDLGINGKNLKVSISEAKLLRAIERARSYGAVVIEELASTETKKSMDILLDSLNLYARAGLKPEWGEKTYRAILRQNDKIRLSKTLIQAALPTLDNKGRVSKTHRAPGGHGHWGVYFLLKSIQTDHRKALTANRGKSVIHAIYNEDGINNTVDPIVVGWMAAENIPLAMITTTKTAIDQKGGLLGILRTGRGKHKIEILEEAQAEANNQIREFREMGLTQGSPGAQYFNTNTALVNFTVLGPFLRDLERALGKMKILEIVSPGLIENRKTGFTQLEGALGSSLIRLDGFARTAGDPKVKGIIMKHGFLDASGRVRLLRLVNVGPRDRLKLFTPVKTAFDFWLQFYSDLFDFNPRTLELEGRNPAGVPSVSLGEPYRDLESVLECFGRSPDRTKNTSVIRLDSLEIQGDVKLEGAALSGKVRILNDSGRTVDLNLPAVRKALGFSEFGRLVLENVRLKIEPSGRIFRQ